MVTKAQQDEVIQRLVDAFQPEAVWLFGSRAWGEPNVDSDLDLLLVVRETDLKPFERAVKAQRSLRGLPVAVDVLVRTQAEIVRLRSVPAALETQILKRGQIVYGSQTGMGSEVAAKSSTGS